MSTEDDREKRREESPEWHRARAKSLRKHGFTKMAEEHEQIAQAIERRRTGRMCGAFDDMITQTQPRPGGAFLCAANQAPHRLPVALSPARRRGFFVLDAGNRAAKRKPRLSWAQFKR
jgi:hypothetical protein